MALAPSIRQGSSRPPHTESGSMHEWGSRNHPGTAAAPWIRADKRSQTGTGSAPTTPADSRNQGGRGSSASPSGNSGQWYNCRTAPCPRTTPRCREGIRSARTWRCPGSESQSGRWFDSSFHCWGSRRAGRTWTQPGHRQGTWSRRGRASGCTIQEGIRIPLGTASRQSLCTRSSDPLCTPLAAMSLPGRTCRSRTAWAHMIQRDSRIRQCTEWAQPSFPGSSIRPGKTRKASMFPTVAASWCRRPLFRCQQPWSCVK
mmetsp:Transcript_56694/g.118538  ORF Transcript_56694/g.118538 Transcript_56694/m.118538 type:complete len:258 (+) Transcript_56694:432-1205(+)